MSPCIGFVAPRSNTLWSYINDTVNTGVCQWMMRPIKKVHICFRGAASQLWIDTMCEKEECHFKMIVQMSSFLYHVSSCFAIFNRIYKMQKIAYNKEAYIIEQIWLSQNQAEISLNMSFSLYYFKSNALLPCLKQPRMRRSRERISEWYKKVRSTRGSILSVCY
jgi:hypothetical protein